jgi:hypothetical protein
MEATETTRHRGVERMVLLRPATNPIGITAIDVDLLPDGYVEIEEVKKPRRDLIRIDVEQGVVIPGVTTSNAPPVLTLRRT